MIAQDPALTGAQVRQIILSSADKVGIAPYDSKGRNDRYGYGRINAERSLSAIPATLSLSETSYTVNEKDRHATVEIERSGATYYAASVHFSTADGSAHAGSDYEAVSKDVTFAPGETEKKISIAIISDDASEQTESVSLHLSSPSGGAVIGSPGSATLLISDSSGATAKISAHLTRASFKRSQAAAVKLVYKVSNARKSDDFGYRLSIHKRSGWVTVRRVAKSTCKSGSHTMTIKQLFASRPIRVGKYSLRLAAGSDSKLLAFRVK